MALTNFEKTVLTIIKQIPSGRVTSYQAIASALKRPRAVRAVGNALHKNPELITVPCHRVVRSDGRLGGYREGPAQKAALLTAEGITVEAGRVRDLYQFLYQF